MSVDVNVTMRGFAEFEKALKTAPKVVEQVVGIALKEAALDIQSTARVNAPLATGKLRRSITAEIRGMTATVGTDLPYARYLEEGTKAHGPVSASHLVFKVGGRWVKTKKVKGIKAMKFLQKAFTSNKRRIDYAMNNAITRILNHLAR